MATRRGGAPRLIEWTGERCVPWAPDVQVVYEHFHRYLWARTLVEGKRVLDVGSGEGFGAALLSERAASVLGIEIDATTIEHSRLNYAGGTLEFRQGSATELDRLPAGSVDVVVAFEIIEHVADHEAVLRGFEHVLAPGGLVIVSTPDRAAYAQASEHANPFHVHELTIGELDASLRARFPNLALFAQRTTTGSRIEALGGEAQRRHAGFSLERAGDEWHVGGPPSPLYVLAVASAAELPELAGDSTLSDFGLELLRAAERRGAEGIQAVQRHADHMESERAHALEVLEDANARGRRARRQGRRARRRAGPCRRRGRHEPPRAGVRARAPGFRPHGAGPRARVGDVAHLPEGTREALRRDRRDQLGTRAPAQRHAAAARADDRRPQRRGAHRAAGVHADRVPALRRSGRVDRRAGPLRRRADRALPAGDPARDA